MRRGAQERRSIGSQSTRPGLSALKVAPTLERLDKYFLPFFRCLQVPTFKDGTVVVNESLAALLYLEQKYPEPCFMPPDVGPQVGVMIGVKDGAESHAISWPYHIALISYCTHEAAGPTSCRWPSRLVWDSRPRQARISTLQVALGSLQTQH